ncbi:MAG: hypothetical protein K8U57_34595 [Planctomycetes bacterium]|nr:hypothetical protein [Planctomycetota bacterium]
MNEARTGCQVGHESLNAFGSNLIARVFNYRARRLVRKRCRAAMLFEQLTVVADITHGATTVIVSGLLRAIGNPNRFTVRVVRTGLRSPAADTDAMGHQYQHGENNA